MARQGVDRDGVCYAVTLCGCPYSYHRTEAAAIRAAKALWASAEGGNSRPSTATEPDCCSRVGVVELGKSGTEHTQQQRWPDMSETWAEHR